jgi:hypothetical protein
MNAVRAESDTSLHHAGVSEKDRASVASARLYDGFSYAADPPPLE